MKSNLPQDVLEALTVKDLEELLERKKKDVRLADLLRERDRLRLELKRIEDAIEAAERAARKEGSSPASPGTAASVASFLYGKRKRSLKDYIAQVLLEAGEPLSPCEIQRRLSAVGYAPRSANPRSLYNTIFQVLQRYEAFEKEGCKYRLARSLFEREASHPTILPRKKTRLKDYIVEVLREAGCPLKVSEIASRVVIAGYQTDLGIDELTQRVSATLKKYLKSDFEWDSQRYRLADRS